MLKAIKFFVPFMLMLASFSSVASEDVSSLHRGRYYCEDLTCPRDCEYARGCTWDYRYGCVETRSTWDNCKYLNRHECRRTRGCDWNNYYNICIRG